MRRSNRKPGKVRLELMKVNETPPVSQPGLRSSPGESPTVAPAAPPAAAVAPDPEVAERPKRRTYTAEFKRQILAEAEACTELGQLGTLLRRHGLYSSHLTSWRGQRARGELAGLTPKKRGPKPEPKNPLADRVAKLERELARTTARAERAERMIALQKKIAELLGEEIPPEEELLEAHRRGLPIPPWRKKTR